MPVSRERVKPARTPEGSEAPRIVKFVSELAKTGTGLRKLKEEENERAKRAAAG